MKINLKYFGLDGMGILIIRKTLGIKQTDLAKMLNMTTPFISRLENNKAPISLDFALRFIYLINKILLSEQFNISKDKREELNEYIDLLRKEVIDKHIKIDGI